MLSHKKAAKAYQIGNSDVKNIFFLQQIAR